MRILLGVLGQSNEAGPGPAGVISRVYGAGGPVVDPVAPSGGVNSWWPRLSQLMAARGHWLTVRNHAVGSTNLCDFWVGRCRAYTASMIVEPGSYVIDGGNVYKAVGTFGNVYTLNVAPSAGVGTSGLASWTNLGAATAADTDGAVYGSTSPRFDPNGKMATLLADLTAIPGHDLRAVAISIGQGDKTLECTRSQYGSAMIAAAQYFTAQGITVFIGFTCYGAATGLDAWYSAELLPGRADAIAALSNNPLVKVGADLRTALGVLATTPASGPGLQADNLHMNYDAMQLAAVAWDSALLAAGY
jgi:hypothetical protein